MIALSFLITLLLLSQHRKGTWVWHIGCRHRKEIKGCPPKLLGRLFPSAHFLLWKAWFYYTPPLIFPALWPNHDLLLPDFLLSLRPYLRGPFQVRTQYMTVMWLMLFSAPACLLLDRTFWWGTDIFFFFCLQFHSVPTSFYLCGWTLAITIVSLLSRSWAVCLAQKTLLCLLSEPSIFSSRVEMLSFVLGSLSRVQILSDRLSRFCFCRLQNPMTQERII